MANVVEVKIASSYGPEGTQAAIADLKGVKEQAAETQQSLQTGGVIRPLQGEDARRNAEEIIALNQRIAETDRAIAAGETETLATSEARVAAKAREELMLSRQLAIAAQLDAAEATLAGNPALAAKLEREADIRLRALAIQRALNVEEAEAIVLAERLVLAEEAQAAAAGHVGINLARAKQEAIVLAREIGTGTVRASTLSSLLGALGPSITIAGIAGYGLYKIITDASEKSLELVQNVKKQADAINSAVTEWIKLSKQAGSIGDTVRLSENVLPHIATIEAKFKELRDSELTGWQKIQEAFAHAFDPLVRYGKEAWHPYTDALNKAREDTKRQQDQVLADARAAIEGAQEATKAWGDFKTLPLSDAIAQINDRLAEYKAQMDSADLSTRDGIQTFHEAGDEFELWSKLAEELARSEEKLAAETQKVAEAIDKASFDKLDDAGKLKSLNADVEQIQARLRELGVVADSPNEALEQAAGLAAKEREEVLKLVAAWAQASSASKQITDAQKKQAEEEKKTRDETIRDLQLQFAIERARLSGHEEEAKRLERERDLQREIAELVAKHLSLEDATRLAIEKQNIELAKESAAQQPRPGPQFPLGGGTHYDTAGRNVTSIPFQGPGRLTRPFFSELEHPEGPSADFQSLLRRPTPKIGELGGAPGEGLGEAADKLRETARDDLKKAADTLKKDSEELQKRATELSSASKSLNNAAAILPGVRAELNSLEARVASLERR